MSKKNSTNTRFIIQALLLISTLCFDCIVNYSTYVNEYFKFQKLDAKIKIQFHFVQTNNNNEKIGKITT